MKRNFVLLIAAIFCCLASYNAWAVTPPPTRPDCVSPSIQASNIAFSNVTSSSLGISWNRGNGTGRIVLAVKIAEGFDATFDWAAYALAGGWNADFALAPYAKQDFGAKSFGPNSGVKIIYKGTGRLTGTVTGFEPGANYSLAVFEYNEQEFEFDNSYTECFDTYASFVKINPSAGPPVVLGKPWINCRNVTMLPNAPTNLVVTGQTSSTLDLAWSNLNTGASSYEIDVWTQPQQGGFDGPGLLTPVVSTYTLNYLPSDELPPINSIIIEDLLPNTQFWWGVRSVVDYQDWAIGYAKMSDWTDFVGTFCGDQSGAGCGWTKPLDPDDAGLSSNAPQCDEGQIHVWYNDGGVTNADEFTSYYWSLENLSESQASQWAGFGDLDFFVPVTGDDPDGDPYPAIYAYIRAYSPLPDGSGFWSDNSAAISVVSDAVVPPCEVWVDADWKVEGELFQEYGIPYGDIPGWGCTAFDNIQAALDRVCPGGIVHVFDGTYTETLTIGQPVSLLGPNGDPNLYQIAPVLVNGCCLEPFVGEGNRADEAIIAAPGTGPCTIDILYGSGNNTGTGLVTVAGFKFIGNNDVANGAAIRTNSSYVTIKNNWFEDISGHAIRQNDAAPLHNLSHQTIEYNYIHNVHSSNGYNFSGIYTDVFSQSLITYNLIVGTSTYSTTNIYAGIQLSQSSNDVTVSHNTVNYVREQGIQIGTDASGQGLYGANTAIFILNNCIDYANMAGTVLTSASDKGGIRLYGNPLYFSGTPSVTITGNTVTNSFNGLVVKAGQNITGIDYLIQYNSFDATNTNAGVYNGATTGQLNAELNWWGDNKGPKLASNTACGSLGNGSNIIGDVLYNPWIFNTENCWNGYPDTIKQLVAFDVTPLTKTICNGTSVDIDLSGSQYGDNFEYHVYLDGTTEVFPSSITHGTGGPLAWTVTITTPGTYTYTVLAYNADNGCTLWMNDQAVITVTPGTTIPSSITISTPQFNPCPNDSRTLTLVGATLGSGAHWAWYEGTLAESATCGTLTPTGTSLTNTFVVTPTGSGTIYYWVRAEYDGISVDGCYPTGCKTIQVNVNTLSTSATGINVNTYSNDCPGSKRTLTQEGGTLGTNAVWQWYTDACGGTFIGQGASIDVYPTVTTTYYVRAGVPQLFPGLYPVCNTTACCSLTVNVTTLSVAPTGVLVTPNNATCPGTPKQLEIQNGTLGYGASWVWYQGGCAQGTGVNTGTGRILSINTPDVTTTYYVRAESPGCLINTTTCSFTPVQVLVVPQGYLTAAPSSNCGPVSGHLNWNPTSGTGPYTVYYTVNGGPEQTAPSLTTPYFIGVGTISSTTTFTLTKVTDANCSRTTGFTGGSAVITINSPLTVSVSIAQSATTVCAGTTVTFTATPTNGGGTPTYAWHVNGGGTVGTNSSYSFVPVNNDLVSCTLTSSLTCTVANPVTTNAITMTVNSVLPVSVSIISSATTVCAGTTVTFTATPTNGGTPTYQWKVGATNVGTNSNVYSYIPTNNDLVTCQLTSSVPCPVANPVTSNTITMTVNPILTVSVSITASATTICSGTTVTFTATPTNGGSTPAYQWKVAGGNVGTNSPTFSTSTLTNGQVVTCVLTSNATCQADGPQTSNAITINVTDNLPVSVTIAASATTVCAGTTVTFTATPTNGGTSPVYTWYKNNVQVPSITGPTYSYVPVTGDYVKVMLASNSGCATGNPATSLTTTITVNPILYTDVVVSPQAPTICAGTTITFTASVTNGGGTETYQWQKNGINVGVNTNTYSSSTLVNGDVIDCYYTTNIPCRDNQNPRAHSNTVHVVVNPLLAVSVSITSSATTVCAGTTVSFTATPTNGGLTPAYQWKVNGGNQGTNSNVFSYVPTNGQTVTCVLTSSETCQTDGPQTSNTITMNVNPVLPVSVSIIASATTICQGTTVTFTATPTNGGTPTYQWKVGATNVGTNSATYSTSTLTNGQIVTCVLTSSETCQSGGPATSNAITITVNNNLPVSVTITPSANNTCWVPVITFTATVINGGGSPTYQWKVNGFNAGTNSQTFPYPPVDGEVVTCVVTSNATCATGNPATSNAVTMLIYPNLPVSVSISATATSICAGSTVTFTATPTNGGAAPAYQWKVNGTNAGTNSNTYTYAPTNGDQVTVILTSNAACTSGNPATSNTITIGTTNNLSVSVSIAASATTVCAGTTVTFTATPTNGGGAPAYQWKVNGTNAGTNSTSFAYVPANGDVVTSVLTSSIGCATGNPATSNAVTITTTSNLPVSVLIAASANPVCAGTTVTFTATPTNGGGAPGYQWKVNGTNQGTNSATFAYVPVTNDAVTCVLTSNSGCATGNPATSNTLTMTVNPILQVGVSIAASATTVCAGTTVSFTATPTNGGGAPAYQWKVGGVNQGTNSATFAYIPLNNDAVTCVLTSNATCPSGPATSNTLTMTVNPILTVTVSITASATTVCAGTTVTFTATPVNGGGSPVYAWYRNNELVPSVTGATYSVIPDDEDAIKCVVTSNATCPSGPATSNIITILVNPILPVSVTISATATTVCSGTTVSFTATPTHGGTTPAYQWKINGSPVGTNSNTFSYAPTNNGDLVTCTLTSNANCTSGNPATSNTITMNVNPILQVGVSIEASARIVCAGTTVTFTATPTNGGSTPAYQWKVGGVNQGTNSATFAYIPLNNDAVTCVLTSNATCPSGPATSNTVTMTVNPILPVSVSITASNTTICAGTTVTFTATPTNGGTPSYQWKVGATNVGTNSATYSTSTLTNGQIVTVVMTSSETCQSGGPATSNPITITVNPILPVSVSITASTTTICAGTTVTFTATPTNGGLTPAYAWHVNGGATVGTNSTYSTSTLTNGQIVTCVLTSSETCQSGGPATSNSITINVNPIVQVSVSISASATTICAGTTVTFTATPIGGGASPFYQWKVGATNVGGNSATYTTTTLANGDIVTCVLTSNATCPSGPATSNALTMTVNPNLTVSVSISSSATTVCAGTTVTFTATPTNGGATPAYQWKVNNVNAGTNSATYTFAPTNGQVVTCVLTSSLTQCILGNPATSNAITMLVHPNPTPTITGANAVCPGATGVVYTTETGDGIYGWNWNITGTGNLITTGTGTNSITVTWAVSGTLTVSYYNIYGCQTLSSAYNVTVVTAPTLQANTIVFGVDPNNCNNQLTTFWYYFSRGGDGAHVMVVANKASVPSEPTTCNSYDLQTLTTLPWSDNLPLVSPSLPGNYIVFNGDYAGGSSNKLYISNYYTPTSPRSRIFLRLFEYNGDHLSPVFNTTQVYRSNNFTGCSASRISGEEIGVELDKYNAFESQKNVFVNWESVYERNIFGYNLLRADITNITGDPDFTTVASYVDNPKLGGKINTTDKSKYSYVDSDPNLVIGHTYLYQLQYVGIDGESNFLAEQPVKVLNMTNNDGSVTMDVSDINPSPAVNDINFDLKLTVAQDVKIELFDLTGHSIKLPNMNTSYNAGLYNIHLSTFDLSSGTYLLSVSNSHGESMIQRFVIVK